MVSLGPGVGMTMTSTSFTTSTSFSTTFSTSTSLTTSTGTSTVRTTSTISGSDWQAAKTKAAAISAASAATVFIPKCFIRSSFAWG